MPLHLQTAYKDLGYTEGSFPVSERIAKEFLSLPMFPELTEEEVDYVANKVIDVVRKLRELSPLYEMAKEGVDLTKVVWTAH